jgi:hypothetical protein
MPSRKKEVLYPYSGKMWRKHKTKKRERRYTFMIVDVEKKYSLNHQGLGNVQGVVLFMNYQTSQDRFYGTSETKYY